MRYFWKFLLLLAFLYAPRLWQIPCHLWIVRAIEMLHETQLDSSNVFQMFLYIFI